MSSSAQVGSKLGVVLLAMWVSHVLEKKNNGVPGSWTSIALYLCHIVLLKKTMTVYSRLLVISSRLLSPKQLVVGWEILRQKYILSLRLWQPPTSLISSVGLLQSTQKMVWTGLKEGTACCQSVKLKRFSNKLEAEKEVPKNTPRVIFAANQWKMEI